MTPILIAKQPEENVSIIVNPLDLINCVHSSLCYFTTNGDHF